MAYRFNGFRLDPVRRLLFGADGLPVPLKPKVFATLLYLVERPGELVAKDTLLEAVWPHVVVEDNNLNKAISTLRHVFGETRDSHRFIVTEPGRGYRFVATVETVSPIVTEPDYGRPEPAAVPTTPDVGTESQRPKRVVTAMAIAAACAMAAIGVYWLATLRTEAVDLGALAPPPSSIAVLPFDNLSPDPDDAYFAVGLHEAILSQLANIREMRVIARASVLGYDGTQKPIPVIARELGVETVLDGSVRYADGQVLVTMHLSDGATNTSLWSESYEREFSTIFTIQNDIALDVARALKTELVPDERERVVRAPTTSLPAYTLYLQAVTRQRRNIREEYPFALGDIEQALALDPDFAAAWAVAAGLHAAGPIVDPERAAEHLSQGERAARRALDLDPDLASAQGALGMVLVAKGDWTGGEAVYREALRRNVPLAEIGSYAMLTLCVANFAYAREIMEEERALSPHDRVIWQGLMQANALLGDWNAAHAQYDSGKRLFSPWPEGDTLLMHLEVGRDDLERARAIPVADPINAAMLASIDDPQSALRELHRWYADPVVAARPLNRRDIALWAGHFGDPALALAAMRSVVLDSSARTLYLWWPQLKEMRQLPAFKTFLREIGIVAYWQEYGWPDICRPGANDDFACD
jgi:TolB-like protein/DNA-binding winged helix-turn-helix (wHTH) protein